MYPITHMAIAVGGVAGGERLWRRLVRRPPGLHGMGFDYRLVALGSQLPDLIDKPLKWFLFPGSLPDSHVYGHTLLLPLCLIAVGLLLARRGDVRLLGFGLGCLTHPLVDPTNTYPRTLFWPLFGTEFPVAKQERGFQPPLEVVVIGAAALWLVASQGVRDRTRLFLRRGSIGQTQEA